MKKEINFKVDLPLQEPNDQLEIIKDFTYTTLILKDDYEGEVTATLINNNLNKIGQKNILYLHGFVDYFFQAHIAEAFIREGYNFYALDLRKYGNSILPHQHKNYCRNMHEYYEEITISIKKIQEVHNSDIYLFGHSTGGLLSCNYLIDGEARLDIKALILNSPFLNLKTSGFTKKIIYFISTLVSSISPYSNLSHALSPAYAQSLHKDFYGEWDFNLDWKPIDGFPAYFKWTRAIIQAQNNLKNPKLKLPILVMHSSCSKDISVYKEEAQSVDIILNIKDIHSIGAQLGEDVTLLNIKDALHDIFLSRIDVRENALSQMLVWLDKH